MPKKSSLDVVGLAKTRILNKPRIFNPEARLEFIQATEHYRNMSPGLKEAFIGAFDQAMEEVFDFPEAAPPVVDTIARRKRIKRFPYVIIYTLDPDAIYIVAVAHNQRDPDHWLPLLGQSGGQNALYGPALQALIMRSYFG